MNDTEFAIIENYVSVKPGEPYRLLPFGPLVKNGKRRNVTPELAAKFKLPHFRPPIKLGSHEDATPAGGHIIGLEVRGDGLYAIPEITDKGAKAFQDGDYRYHSPEIIWSEDAGFEDPSTGELITGPLIVGDALLHTPHLGESTAFYTVEVRQEGQTAMTDEKNTVEVPRGFMDWLKELFGARVEQIEQPETEPLEADTAAIDAEEYAAIQAERDEYRAKIEAIEAEKEHKARVEKFGAALSETKVSNELAEVMAGLPDEVAERIMQEFKALSAQINESALTEEIGAEGDGPQTSPVEALSAKIDEIRNERKLNYADAVRVVAKEHPELFEAAR